MTMPLSAVDRGVAARAPQWVLIMGFVAATVIFFFATRSAYKGYFSDDDLEKVWPTVISNSELIREIVTPELSRNNFRPIGILYYRYMGRAFKLEYRPWLAVLQAGHLINVILLFFVLRRLSFSDFAAGAGTLFYVFHGALIYIYWQPQYIFEVLAAMLTMVTLLFYMRGRWILALIAFWLAYKAKEIVVTLPIALLAWEWLLGDRKWKRLIPYFVISLNFGLQALWANSGRPSSAGYVLHFSPKVLWQTIAFYSSAIFFVPYAGLALLSIPVLIRDRRVWFGLIFTAALFVPMLALPSRLESVYWYIPMIGLTIVFAYAASRVPPWTVAVFFVLWFPLNYQMMKPKRTEMLAHFDQARWFVNGLLQYQKQAPPLKAVVIQETPPFMGYWGIYGAIHQVFGMEVDATWYLDPEVHKSLAKVPMAIVGYYPGSRTVKGLLRERDEPESYLRFSVEAPASQLIDGWRFDDASYRWIQTKAELMLRRPAGAAGFEIVAFIPERSPEKSRPTSVTVIEEGQSMGTQTLPESSVKPQSLRWKIPGGAAGERHLKIVIEPASHGIAINGIGYVSQ